MSIMGLFDNIEMPPIRLLIIFSFLGSWSLNTLLVIALPFGFEYSGSDLI